MFRYCRLYWSRDSLFAFLAIWGLCWYDSVKDRQITKNTTSQLIPCRVFHSRKKIPHAFYALLGITIFRSGPTKFAFFFLPKNKEHSAFFSANVSFVSWFFHLHPSMKTLSTRQWLSKAGHGRRDDPHLSPGGQLGAAELAAKCRELHQQRQANGFTKTKALWCVYFSMETLVWNIIKICQDCKESQGTALKIAWIPPSGPLATSSARPLCLGPRGGVWLILIYWKVNRFYINQQDRFYATNKT